MGSVHFGSDGMFSGNFGGNILCTQNTCACSFTQPATAKAGTYQVAGTQVTYHMEFGDVAYDFCVSGDTLTFGQRREPQHGDPIARILPLDREAIGTDAGAGDS
jgi:hypothetical protein